jgi:hypothetical protein
MINNSLAKPPLKKVVYAYKDGQFRHFVCEHI